MYNIENKKIAVGLILIAVFGIILSVFLRQDIHILTTSRITMGLYEDVPNDYRFIKHIKTKDVYQSEKTIYEYDSYYIIDGVSIVGLEFRYKSLITLFITLIGVSIYLFLYKNDDAIKSDLISLRMRLVLKKGKKSHNAKFYILFSLIAVSIIALMLLGVKYYLFLQTLRRPLRWGESLFMGFSKLFLIITVITIATGIFKSLINQKNQ